MVMKHQNLNTYAIKDSLYVRMIKLILSWGIIILQWRSLGVVDNNAMDALAKNFDMFIYELSISEMNSIIKDLHDNVE